MKKMKKNRNQIAICLLMGTVSLFSSVAFAQQSEGGTPGNAYPNMPAIAPIGTRIGKYLDVNESAKGPAIDPAKGYRLQEMGEGLFMITDNAIQSMFMVYDKGVVVMDAPENLVNFIPKAIAEVTHKPITYFIYSHHHADHVGGAGTLLNGKHVVIIGHEETKRLLARANDPARPVPTVTFTDAYKLKLGSQTLELTYHGNGHEPGNTFIYAPKQRTLMVIDVIFPGWMPWRRFALAQDIPGYFRQVEEINKMDWDKLITGHVERSGTHEDVALQLEFITDLKNVARKALKSTPFIEGINAADKDNPWAVFDDYIDRVVIQCVNTLSPKWSTKLAGYDAFIWDQCLSMEQSVRLDEH
jgi:glyoxylase-like metal-dependent hydrolase (beta-lactamase superfamily II)